MILKIDAIMGLDANIAPSEPQMEDLKRRIRSAIRAEAVKVFPRSQVQAIETWPVEIRVSERG